MDAHLALSIFALLTALASWVYAVRVNRRIPDPSAMSDADCVCHVWNQNYPIGIWVAYEPEPFDPRTGRIAVRTLSAAYVEDGKPVIDVEQMGTIELNRRVHKIG